MFFSPFYSILLKIIGKIPLNFNINKKIILNDYISRQSVKADNEKN